MLDAEAGEDAADDHRVGAIDAAAGRGSVEGPAGPVGVERPGQAVGGEDGPRGPSARHGWSLRPERRVEQPRGRLVDDREARLALARTEGEPLLVAAVEVQELTEAGAGLSAPSMAVSGRGPGGPGPRPGGRASRTWRKASRRARPGGGSDGRRSAGSACCRVAPDRPHSGARQRRRLRG